MCVECCGQVGLSEEHLTFTQPSPWCLPRLKFCCADGSDGSSEAALSDIDVADLLESPEQVAFPTVFRFFGKNYKNSDMRYALE